MAHLKIFKELTLPEVLLANSIYLIADHVDPKYLEMYVTDKNGTAQRRIPTNSDIKAMIQTAVQNIDVGTTYVQVVDDITARDELVVDNDTLVMVIDATGDSTVTAGAATYIYRESSDSWAKISEAESMDLVLTWDNITNKPTSTTQQIDTAVQKMHDHQNISTLNDISESNGDLLFKGYHPRARLETENW